LFKSWPFTPANLGAAVQDKLWHGYISNDEDNVLEALLELMKSVRRWNPRLLAQDPDEAGAAGKVGSG
jgi:hypothetical protein